MKKVSIIVTFFFLTFFTVQSQEVTDVLKGETNYRREGTLNDKCKSSIAFYPKMGKVSLWVDNYHYEFDLTGCPKKETDENGWVIITLPVDWDNLILFYKNRNLMEIRWQRTMGPDTKLFNTEQ